MSEEVMVIQNKWLQPYFKNQQTCLITRNKEKIYENILKNYSFMPRHIAEYNNSFKQVIPYIIIHNRDSYLLLRRTSKQTEKRLHNKYSLGVGGHINPNVTNPDDNIIISGLYKELNEEISISDPAKLNFVGIINDESSSVGKVHLGLLYVYYVLSSEYEILEKEKMSAQWIFKNDLKKYYNKLETWSQIIYDFHIIERPIKNHGS